MRGSLESRAPKSTQFSTPELPDESFQSTKDRWAAHAVEGAALLALGHSLKNGGPKNATKALGLAWLGTAVGEMASSLYVHRYATHGQFELSPQAKAVLEPVVWLAANGMDPVRFAQIHRYHHETSDTPDDPHAPTHKGRLQILFLHNLSLRKDFNPETMKPRGWEENKPKTTPMYNRLYKRGGLGLAGTFVVHDLVGRALHIPPRLRRVSATAHIIGMDRVLGALTSDSHWDGEPQNLSRRYLVFPPILSGERKHKDHHDKPGRTNIGGNQNNPDLGFRTIELLARHGHARFKHPEDIALFEKREEQRKLKGNKRERVVFQKR